MPHRPPKNKPENLQVRPEDLQTCEIETSFFEVKDPALRREISNQLEQVGDALSLLLQDRQVAVQLKLREGHPGDEEEGIPTRPDSDVIIDMILVRVKEDAKAPKIIIPGKPNGLH